MPVWGSQAAGVGLRLGAPAWREGQNGDLGAGLGLAAPGNPGMACTCWVRMPRVYVRGLRGAGVADGAVLVLSSASVLCVVRRRA